MTFKNTLIHSKILRLADSNQGCIKSSQIFHHPKPLRES